MLLCQTLLLANQRATYKDIKHRLPECSGASLAGQPGGRGGVPIAAAAAGVKLLAVL